MFEIIIGLSIGCVLYIFLKASKKTNYRNVEEPVVIVAARGQDAKKRKVPHKKRNYLCTNTENNFYQVLLSILPEDYVVHSQVSMMALVQPVNFKHNSKTWAKRVDFVITDKNTKILAVIELNDSSHHKQKRQERDQYVSNAFRDLHPLLRFEVENCYDPTTIIDKLEQYTEIKCRPLEAVA